jgi:hypothetical protein
LDKRLIHLTKQSRRCQGLERLASIGAEIARAEQALERYYEATAAQAGLSGQWRLTSGDRATPLSGDDDARADGFVGRLRSKVASGEVGVVLDSGQCHEGVVDRPARDPPFAERVRETCGLPGS